MTLLVTHSCLFRSILFVINVDACRYILKSRYIILATTSNMGQNKYCFSPFADHSFVQLVNIVDRSFI
jgi:hypothetical protein